MRILVVKTTSMGDVVHTLPAITDMAAAMPGLEIDWLVEKPFAAIASLHPAVRRVVPIQWRKWRKNLRDPATRAAMAEVKATLRSAQYDLVIDFQGLLKSAWWARQAKAPIGGYAWGSAREALATLFYQRRATVSRDRHAVDRSRRLASALLGYALPDTPPSFGVQAPTSTWMPPSPYAVLIPCASRVEKLWPVEHWQALVQRIEASGLHAVIMWGSPEEAERAKTIAAGSGAVVPPFLTVADAAAVLAGASWLVGLDTGFTHLGAAFGKPCVGIYCDHEPGLAGVTGSGRVVSLGGKGQRPGLAQVMQALDDIL